jgi:CspA family cold shock protein
MEGYKTLKAGQPVTFEVIQGPKGLHAVNISPVEVESTSAPETVKVKTKVTETH